ncbi:unnamed protein product [Prorocentrum cordatum]|uniref:Clp1 P-loop domain-containing protein n=1 Tax=Prorocentrum cordatum TaxID=2364126 RepID=A0ABN9TDV8_9DINO|nr:unnamed protein product [Polarella glacialis]
MVQKQWSIKNQQRSTRIIKRLVARTAEQPGPAQWLLPLRRGEELTVSGGLDFRVIRGAVEIWGASCRPSSEFQRVVAPPWSALPRLRAAGPSGTAGAPAELAAEAEEAETDDVREFLQSRSWPVVLCLRAVGPEPPGSLPAPVRERLLAPLERQRLRAHRAWPSLVEQFAGLAAQPTSARPPVLLVTGPKGVGKSACCRYFANSLLGALGEVYYLETDLGQPELGPPTLVSLYRLRRPLLQAPHSEQGWQECLCSFFAGGTSPATHPVLYVKCMRAAFDRYVSECSDSGSPVPPLVVNSHGWVTGLGLELVQVLLGIVQAQLVIRIQSPSSSQAPPLGDAAAEGHGTGLQRRRRTALARCGPLALALGEAALASEEPRSSVVVDVDSLAGASQGGAVRAPSLGAVELRWLRLACHFRPDLDPCKAPASLTPRAFFRCVPRVRLPLRGLRFGLVHGGCLAPGEVEAAFTGTVVALCRAEAPLAPLQPAEDAEADGKTGVTELPAVLGREDAQEAAECIGIGYVHSFDFAVGDVEVRVAPSIDTLAKVGVILRGDVSWEPNSVRGQRVMMAGMAADNVPVSLQPHCCSWALEGPATGAKVLSSRRNLKRKRSGAAGGAGAAAPGSG